MKQPINEIKRMQQLAGLINENQTGEEWGPSFVDLNSPKARILTDVYYIGDNAEGELRPLRGSAVPSYELPGYTLEDIKNKGNGMLYIKKGEEGWYDEKDKHFESYDESSTVYIPKKYIEFI